LKRRARVLVAEFHLALGFVLDEFLTPEDRLCYQQVHDGVAEQCMWDLAGLGLGE